MNLKISVIIPTFNKPAYLNRTLSCLSNQTSKLPYEIIVIDDYNNNTKAEEISRFWSQKTPVKYFKVNQFKSKNGRAVARNLGIQKAKGGLLIFIDDDIIVHPGFIQEHINAHYDKTNQVVIGYRHYLRPTYRFIEYINPVNLFGDFNIIYSLPQVNDEREQIYRICNDNLNNLSAPWTVLFSNNFSIFKKLILSVGGFEEIFQDEWGAEDIELGYRLQRMGAVFSLSRKANGYHQWHHNNWQKKIGSLQNNLIKFYNLHPTFEAELYLNYVDVGLKNFLFDLKRINRFLSKPRQSRQISHKDIDLIQSKGPISGKVLLLGWDENLFYKLKPFHCCDIRKNVLAQVTNKNNKSNFSHIYGIHTSFKYLEFDNCFINANSWVTLKHYHVKNMIEESLRIAKNTIIYLPKYIIKKVFAKQIENLDNHQNSNGIYSKLGLNYYSNLDIENTDYGSFFLCKINKLITKRHNVGYNLFNSNPRIVFVFCPNAKENFNNHILELALELDQQGCDVCFELEDARTELVIPNSRANSLKKYFSHSEWLRLQRIFSKNIEGLRKLYPRLSVTGHLHYYDKVIDWLHPNYIGALPSYQVFMLNHSVDLIWSTSKDISDYYLKSGGMSSKINTIHVGVNWELTNSLWASRQKNKKVSFTFLAIGTVAKRDGIDLVIKAFCEEFKNDKKVKLFIKLLPTKIYDFEQKKGIYNFIVKNDSRKYSEMVRAITSYKLKSWRNIIHKAGIDSSRFSIINVNEGIRNCVSYFKEGDCYVQAHRSDLIGERVIQAMAAGLPVIATNRYLVDGLCTPQNSYSVRSRETSAVMDEWSSDSIYCKWAEPNIHHLCLVMRHVMSNSRERLRKCKKAREDIIKKWDWSIIAKEVIQSLSSLSTPNIIDNKESNNGRLDTLLLQLFQNDLLSIEEESIERK